MSDTPDLSDAPRLRELLATLPASTAETSEALDVAPTTVESYRNRLEDVHGVDLEYDRDANEWCVAGDVEWAAADDETDAWADEPISDADPSAADLSERERYIVRELQTGAYVDELADDLDTRATVVDRHLRELRSQGWQIYRDETTETVTIEGDLTLRSSEHKGTRTRKANRWWEQRHNNLVRDFRALDRPTADVTSTIAHEDWVHVLGDVHAGDKVWTPGPDPKQVYDIETVGRIVRYDTQKSLALAEYHGARYDTAHLLWNGDFVTNEGIYSGQFQDLDAWLDEQHDSLMEPLLEQVTAYADRFDTVNVVAQVGNHGEHRASGTSRQANADLILYKSVRNAIAALQKYADEPVLDNVNFRIGQARPYVNFPLRGGDLRGHLRHGQDRRPQAETRARHDDWVTTLQNHDFDVAFINHHHVSGEIPWDGPPIVVSGTPKPPSDFVDRIAGATSLDPRERAREISHCLGVADHGVTGRYPIKTHDFDYLGETAR